MTELSSNLILSCDPDFVDLALAELEKTVDDAQVVATLADGVMAVHLPDGFVDLAERWRKSPPIFVRHICAVDEIEPLTGKAADVHILRQCVDRRMLDQVDPTLPFSVQTRILAGEEAAVTDDDKSPENRSPIAVASSTGMTIKPFDVNKVLSETVTTKTGAPIDVRHPQQILSVVIASASEDAPQNLKSKIQNPKFAYLGISLAAHNISNWAGGMRRFAREEGQVSRAEFKLLEALDVFGLDLPKNGVALDLGASPGGWTRVLRQRGQYVTAVDPGQLDARVARDPNVRHKRMFAEEYLRDEPDRFDVIVNDMRMDARDSARLMVAFSRQLYRHGLAIMTLKLPEENRQSVVDHAFKLLREGYVIAGARQLFHNRSEITVYLRTK